MPDDAVKAKYLRLLHNAHEHAEHLETALFNPQVSDRVKEKLLGHIMHENARHIEECDELLGASAGALDHEIVQIRHHFELMQVMAEKEEITPEVSQRLIHHFQEEHLELFEEFGDPEFSSRAVGNKATTSAPESYTIPTVGSLRG